MFKKLFIALALCLSFSAYASDYVDLSGLSASQIAELKSVAAAKVAANAKEKDGSGDSVKDSTVLMTMASTWGAQAATAAEGFAKALSIAARELGITVNDFLHTDAGKLTALLIIWKIAGVTIIHILYGMVLFLVGMIVVRAIYMRLFTEEYQPVTYSRLFGAFTGTKMVRIPKSISALKTDGEWLTFFVILILTALTLIFTGFIIA